MVGRAGRPQFDERGVAVLMTEQEKVDAYRECVEDMVFIESHLLDTFQEQLNVAINCGVVRCVAEAKEWLRSSFFYQRLISNPKVT